MEYVKLRQLRAKKRVPDGRLAFLKRWGFRIEKEYRIVFESKDKESLQHKSFRIGPDVIRRVVINPWMHNALFQAIGKILKSLKGWEDLVVDKSPCH